MLSTPFICSPFCVFVLDEFQLHILKKKKALARKLTQVWDRDEVMSKVTRVRSRSIRFLLLFLKGTTSNEMFFKHVHDCPERKSKMQKPHISYQWKESISERKNVKLLFQSNTLFLGALIAVILCYDFPK
jgi:hypothetical protein